MSRIGKTIRQKELRLLVTWGRGGWEDRKVIVKGQGFCLFFCGDKNILKLTVIMDV